jgi:proton-dependent oligopeptide transporter, POT family
VNDSATPSDEDKQTTLKSLAAEPPAEKAKGHPRGLYFLFFTEMWERFGYYGMRALLVLYMINYLQWQPQASSSVYKWYTSLVYLTPLAGGFIADRLLGLRFSIIIGGALMAGGYFMLGVEALFYPALAFIIVGNGFFKPNISTMVGKMYKQGDARRDGAFTIFYMGINLGAFLSPLICGTLADKFAPKYGFMAAGVGMLIGLTVFLMGQARVTRDIAAAGNALTIEKAPAKEKADLSSTKKASGDDEAREPGATGFAGLVGKIYPLMMIAIGVGVPIYYILMVVRGVAPLQDAIMPIAFAAISGGMGFTLTTIKGASRDRSTVIFILFMFAVLFWMAFEQAGNALNIWADVHTDRKVMDFTYPASWWQSANAIFIVVLAPMYAALWVYLARTGKEPSTPAKMALAMVFMVLSFGAMVGGAAAENAHESRIALEKLPPQVVVEGDALIWAGAEKNDDGFLDAKRLSFDAAKKELVVRGVLPPFAVNDALKRTAPADWLKEVDKLDEATKKATEASPAVVHVTLPTAFEPPYDDKDQKAHNVKLGPAGDFTFTAPLDAPTKTALVGAGAAPEWRKPLKDLERKSWDARVSGFWLFLSYFLATLGELCLSPVGLSMVTKLAPARFASLFMGVWLLASSVAQYMGGAIGESWGKITPSAYFNLFVMTSVVGVVAAAVLIKPLRTLMHKVH